MRLSSGAQAPRCSRAEQRQPLGAIRDHGRRPSNRRKESSYHTHSSGRGTEVKRKEAKAVELMMACSLLAPLTQVATSSGSE